MKRDQQEFEAFLREFRPREPAPLPVAVPFSLRRRLAAAAVVLLATGTSVWLATRALQEARFLPAEPELTAARLPGKNAAPAPLTLFAFTQLAQSDPQKLDAILDADSRRILPSFQEKGSTLAVLAKE